MEQNNTITVTGCGDCPMCIGLHDIVLCIHPDKEPVMVSDIFDVCPLKQSTLTIQLKQDEQENI
jgi:hypothetical protein